MRNWEPLLRFVRDNITLLVFIAVVAIMGAAWVVFEALRSHQRRDEIFALKRKLSEMERERTSVGPGFRDPVVLSSRWIQSGAAAATSDGGCLLVLEKVQPAARSIELTLRIDGYAVFQNHSLRSGERLEASGKNGIYILELYGLDGMRANLAVALRNHHSDAEA